MAALEEEKKLTVWSRKKIVGNRKTRKNEISSNGPQGWDMHQVAEHNLSVAQVRVAETTQRWAHQHQSTVVCGSEYLFHQLT